MYKGVVDEFTLGSYNDTKLIFNKKYFFSYCICIFSHKLSVMNLRICTLHEGFNYRRNKRLTMKNHSASDDYYNLLLGKTKNNFLFLKISQTDHKICGPLFTKPVRFLNSVSV